MLGGGGCGGTPRRLVRTHLPRSTGEVRFGYDVTVSMLAWPSSPRRASFGDLHAAELAAVDVGNAVMPRQPLVDERVVGIQQIHDAAVFAHDAVEEQRRLFLHRLTQVVVEIGERTEIRAGVLEIAQVQPLLGEVGR